MFGFGKKIHKREGELAAKRLSEIVREKNLSPQEFLMQADTLVFDALRSIGIMEKLSNGAYKEICQLAVVMGERQYTMDDVNRVLKHFKG